MSGIDRRTWMYRGLGGVVGATLLGSSARFEASAAQEPGARPSRDPSVEVLNPREHVPVSLIIDDSTCLVNLAHFAIPQFRQVFPDRYRQAWRELPREIPDAFVREFLDWCRDHRVKGKYSIVPYPACVGWLDRELPGWSADDLEASLRLVRDEVTPDWDIHPEMVTHTWIIDTKTGRPYPEKSEQFMENWRWTDGRSVDELAEYMVYALRILDRVGLRCEGITTPGGFGNRVLPELAQASFQAVREVSGATIPHYFRHLYTDDRSAAPRVEYASGLDGDDPRCVVSIIGCTGDWFGGWDGLTIGSVDRFITEDLQGGRLPEVIERGEPAVLVCHWPGFYCNGEKTGYRIFQEVVRRLEGHPARLTWMTLAEIARYWAAKELTGISKDDRHVTFEAPYACSEFTVTIGVADGSMPETLQLVDSKGRQTRLDELKRGRPLKSGTFRRDPEGRRIITCFDLPRGRSRLEFINEPKV